VSPYNIFKKKREAKELAVILGDHNRNKKENEILVRVESKHVHDKYDPDNYDNDIALLQVADPIKFSHNIHPACLPSFGTASLYYYWNT
jgi:secreted trypsin-like serine protease